MTTSDTSVWNIIEYRPEEAQGNAALDRYLYDDKRVLPFEGPGFRVRQSDTTSVPIAEVLRARNELRLQESNRSLIDQRAQSNLMLSGKNTSLEISGLEATLDLPSTRGVPTNREGLTMGTPQSKHTQRERLKAPRRLTGAPPRPRSVPDVIAPNAPALPELIPNYGPIEIDQELLEEKDYEPMDGLQEWAAEWLKQIEL